MLVASGKCEVGRDRGQMVCSRSLRSVVYRMVRLVLFCWEVSRVIRLLTGVLRGYRLTALSALLRAETLAEPIRFA